jgi:cytochrome c oxidase subunit IV
MLIGIVLVVFGILFLLQNLGYITYDFGGMFWPLVLIAIGLKISMKRGKNHWCCGHHRGEKEESPKS